MVQAWSWCRRGDIGTGLELVQVQDSGNGVGLSRTLLVTAATHRPSHTPYHLPPIACRRPPLTTLYPPPTTHCCPPPTAHHPLTMHR